MQLHCITFLYLENMPNCSYGGRRTIMLINKISRYVNRIYEINPGSIFLEALKIATMIPLFKKGSRQDFSNYRPISLLTIISKIFETVFWENRSLNILMTFSWWMNTNLISDRVCLLAMQAGLCRWGLVWFWEGLVFWSGVLRFE